MVGMRSGRSSARGIDRLAKDLALSAQLSFDERRTLFFAHKARKTLMSTRSAYRELLFNLNERVQATQGIEVLLDNFYIIEGALAELLANWKQKITFRIPQSTDTEGAKQPRVYMIARALVKETGARIDREILIEFLKAYQKSTPLSLRELDVFPSMLSFALIEDLRRLININISVLQEKSEADRWYLRIMSTSLRKDAPLRLRKLTAVLALEYTIVPQVFGLHLLHRLAQTGKEGDVRMVSKWLKLSLAKQGASYAQLSTMKSRTEKAQAVIISNAISSLRYLAQVRWDKISLELNMVDAVLAKDPSGTFLLLTDDARSMYRRTIARIGDGTSTHDIEVAREALRLARQAFELQKDESQRSYHVGYYLIDKGVLLLEHALGYSPTTLDVIQRFILTNSTRVYLGFIGTITVCATGILLLLSVTTGLAPLPFLVLLLAGPVLTSEIATALTHFLLTRLLAPKPLPAIDLTLGVGSLRKTVVVVPSMFRNSVSAQKLLRRMETNFVANNDANIFYALLMDFQDAEQEIMPDDAASVNELREGIALLNARYPSLPTRFSLFYRSRKWNPAEKVFMGWERKRGKLREFNGLLRGKTTSYAEDAQMTAQNLGGVRYIITLDEDTELVRDSAQALIGTIEHPLNRPVIDKEKNIVTEGYGIIQPRTALRHAEGSASLFSQLFGGFPGIESYSSLVSDLHQDLFNEGIFYGKGIYDIDAIETTMADRMPENTVLSHDLLEGLYARVGIASGAHIFEGFPSNYREHMQRLHRWIRGDWQIINWLLKRGEIFSPIARYRIFDNLRRSLIPVTAVIAVVFSTFSPTAVSLWSMTALLALGSGQLVSALLHITERTTNWRRTVSFFARFKSMAAGLGVASAKTFLLGAFVLHNAIITLDAIARSMWRLYVSKKKLLEWQTAYAVALERKNSVTVFMTFMWQSICLALLLVYFEFHRGSIYDPLATLWIFVWLCAPFCAAIISFSYKNTFVFSKSDRLYLHKIAARTHWFFLDLPTKNDQWLVPDHLQEEPPSKRHSHGLGISPTNLGMYLLSLSGGRVLGLSSISEYCERISRAFATMEKMPLHKGHFFNWYELKGLTPLPPCYVSSVDSANLALSLVAVHGALLEACRAPIISNVMFEGLEAELHVLLEACDRTSTAASTDRHERKLLEEVKLSVGESLTLIQKTGNDAVTARGGDLVWSGIIHHSVRTRNALEILRLEGKTERFDEVFLAARHVEAMASVYRDTISQFLGYTMIPAVSAVVNDPKLHACYLRILSILQRMPNIDELANGIVRREIESVEMEEAIMLSSLPGPEKETARAWYAEVLFQLSASEKNTKKIQQSLHVCAASASLYVKNMDFKFLYNNERGLFHIGFNSTTEKLDEAFYDLLASEANSASIIAITKRDVPQKHWGYLGRKLIKSGNGDILVASWAGSLFEYLGTLLYFDVPRESFWGTSARRAIAAHRGFAKQYRIPWGMGESASSRQDAAQNYHYQAFGEASLGFKRDLSESIVVAPYTSALALSLDPKGALQNFAHLEHVGASGRYGFYDAIDFTARKRGDHHDAPGVPAQIYYAHHQGFILLSIVNALADGWVQKMVAHEPEMEVATQLFEEKMPEDVEAEEINLIAPPKRSVRRAPKIIESERQYLPWKTHEAVSLFLSSNKYSSRITTTGAGESYLGNVLITRPSADMLRESVGTFFYLRDRAHGKTWSPTYMPMRDAGDKHAVAASEQAVTFEKSEGSINSSLVATVLPGEAGELRELTLTNTGESDESLSFGVCAELSLSKKDAESAHPNYEHLFVATEVHWGNSVIIASRPDPEDRNRQIVAGFLLTADHSIQDLRAIREKKVFFGSKKEIAPPMILQDFTRADAELPLHTLDSVAAFVGHISLGPNESRRVSLISLVGKSKEEVLSGLKRYRNYANTRGIAKNADREGGRLLSEYGISSSQAHAYSTLASLALSRAMKRGKDVESDARPWVLSLWKMSISGNRPIILFTVTGVTDLPMVRQMLSCHAYFVKKGIPVDIVIFNEHSGGYLKTFEDEVDFLMNMHRSHDERSVSTVFHARAEQLSEIERAAVLHTASVVIDAKKGSLIDAITLLERKGAHAYPPKLETQKDPDISDETFMRRDKNDLQFFNGVGGYDKAQKEYVIFYGKNIQPPRPWSHIVANSHIGFLATDRGMSFTWATNSYDNKLTVPYNDPLAQFTSEAIYLRDEETGVCASPLPLLGEENAEYEIRYGINYCTYLTHAFGITLELTLYIDDRVAIKYYRVKLTNNTGNNKILSLFGYFELLLGSLAQETKKHFSFEIQSGNTLVASQNYWHQFVEKRTIVGIVTGADEFSVSREEFLGRNGTINDPAALKRIGLSSDIVSEEEPAAVLMKRLSLEPGESKEATFFLGECNVADLEKTISQITEKGYAEQVLKKTRHKWEMAPFLKFDLPDPTLTLLANHFLPEQVIASRVHARLGFYQIGGAYGYRDQLQDGLAMLWLDSAWTRSHILAAAAHQFREGDALSWWQPHNDFGARTRLSDPHLWLPHVVLRYVQFTGDSAILDEVVPYLSGDIPDKADRPSIVGVFLPSDEKSSLYEHCIRAVEHSLTSGSHGLPLMGQADWNDGMNRVGVEGEGESVWLAWFLISILDEMSTLTEGRGDSDRANRYRAHATEYREALQKSGWDGKWYRRAFTDTGAPVGTNHAKSFRIDSVAQSWAYFANGKTKESIEALESAKHELGITKGHIPLAWPPSSRSLLDMGTISDYPPGVRENASQYNHAALWLAQALFASGDPDGGMAVVDAVNPFKRSDTAEKSLLYQGEPYVVAAEVYSTPTYPGRAGWTWYTASAGVLYRTICEYILGIKREGNLLSFSPSFPKGWNHASALLPYGKSQYNLKFEAIEGDDEIMEIFEDGVKHPTTAVKMVDDKRSHEIIIRFKRKTK